jgi:hypothetical protein
MMEIPAIMACAALWHMDPRGIEGPGYLLMLVVGPLTYGWTICGVIEAVGWLVARCQPSVRS